MRHYLHNAITINRQKMQYILIVIVVHIWHELPYLIKVNCVYHRNLGIFSTKIVNLSIGNIEQAIIGKFDLYL